MPRKLRCPRPINPILMMGRRGHQVFQRISNNVCAVAGARNIGGGGPGPAPSVADFIAYAADGAGVLRGLVKGIGPFIFARATEATVTTQPDGLVKTAKVNELRFENGRRVENLATGLVTETVTVINGGEYQLTILGANGATAVCSGAFTGTLTANGVNRISWPNGVPKTATSTSLTITVTGTLTQMLLEHVSGQANQNPSEYVSVGVGTGDNVWTDNPDTVEAGWTDNGDGSYTCDGTNNAVVQQDEFSFVDNRRYEVKFTISAYNSGTLRILLYGPDLVALGGNVSAAGDYTQILTIDQPTGTSNRILLQSIVSFDGTISNISVREIDHGAGVDGVKCFNYANNNSVSPGGVVNESKGATFSTVPRALYEPAATNEFNNSRDLTQASWSKVQSVVTAYDEVGIGGVENTATTVTDNNVSGAALCRENIPITGNTVTSIVAWIKKDTDTTRFPVITSQLSGGTTKTASGWLNTETGAITTSGSDAANLEVSSEQIGAWWKFTCTHTDTGNNTNCRADIVPAQGTVFGVFDPAAVGSIIVGQADGLKNTSHNVARGSSPIFTSGSSVTRTADDGNPSFDFANWSQTEGTWYLDVWMSDPTLPQQSIFAIQNSYASVLYNESGQFRSNDGTSTARATVNAVVDQRFRVASDFGTGDTLECGSRNIDASGSWGFDLTPPNYDGAFETNSTMQIARSLTTPIRIAVFTGYKTRQGKDWIEDNL